MKTRNKRKFHPSSTPTRNKNPFSVLNLLPTAIITLLSVLCIEEREVLAYMITRSLKSAEPTARDTRKSSKKHSFVRHKSTPLFDCDCFQCYVSFWYKWDSSPNRVLIHDAIEAFEEHLNNGEFNVNALKKGVRKSKKKEKMGLRKNGNVSQFPVVAEVEVVAAEKRGGGEVALPVLVGGGRCLARKVLPDFMGLFNSRFWSLWNPNV